MSAGQDHPITIAPGGIQRIKANGESYLFCRFADRDISVNIAGRQVIMRAGSYQEFEPLSGENSAIVLENPDTENPAAVIFVTGTGTYDEKIVRGEISVEPILRNADGTTKSDTRFQLAVDLMPVSAEVETLPVGTLLYRASIEGTADDWLSGGGVFRRPDGVIAQTVLTEFGGKYGLAEFDDKGNLLEVGEVTKDGGKNDATLAWTPETGYVVAKGGNVRGPLVIGSTASLQTFFSWGKTIQDMTVDKNGNLVLIDDSMNVAVVETATFTIVKQAQITGISNDTSWTKRIAYDSFNDRYLLSRFNDAGNYLLDADFENPQSIGSVSGLNINDGRDVFRNVAYVSEGAQSTTLHGKRVFREYDTSPQIEAYRAGCGLTRALVKEGAPPVISADVTVSDTANGFTVEGELIKATLEYYFRKKVPDNYLDHIYAVDASQSASGGVFIPIVTGNQTFKRAGVADSFGALAPGQVIITLDNELTLGGAL